MNVFNSNLKTIEEPGFRNLYLTAEPIDLKQTKNNLVTLNQVKSKINTEQDSGNVVKLYSLVTLNQVKSKINRQSKILVTL